MSAAHASSSIRPVSPPSGPVVAAVLAGGGVTAVVLATAGPIALAGASAALLLLAFTVRFAAAVPGLYLNALTVLLAGYAFFGRSFAYLGVAPVYVGEVLLAAGLVAAVCARRHLPAVASLPQTWMLVALAAWGALQTLPYVGTAGVNALRDATLWGYGAFAIVVAATLLSTGRLPALVDRYVRVIPWLAAWIPLAYAVTRLLGDGIPNIPGTNVALLSIKMGDAGVHLAGAAAFALTFGLGSRARPVPSALRVVAFWAVWFVALAAVLIQNRGGFVAVVSALGVLAVLRPVAIGRRVALAAGAAAIVGGSFVLVASLDRALPQTSTDGRATSPGQLAANVMSIVNPDADYVLGGTRQWRLDWWNAVTGYTLHGPYFWTGKGFGVNLADDDGFQVSPDGAAPLRSPHNVHITFLARTGVPGVALWILVQLAFAGGLLRAYVRARRLGAWPWAHLNLWLLAYWAAFLVNASFDVFLESPQGGIWFWCLFGVGLAALASQASALRTASRARG